MKPFQLLDGHSDAFEQRHTSGEPQRHFLGFVATLSWLSLMKQILFLPMFILSKLVIALLGFPRLGAGIYTQTAHEYT